MDIHYTVYIRVKYNKSHLFMAARQVMLIIEDVHTISGFHITVKDQITYYLHRYKLPLDDVEYVELCFREVNLHLITVVKLDPVVNRIETLN